MHNRVVGALYARIAIGRDYTDAAPMHGAYQGRVRETLAVRVRMRAAAGEVQTIEVAP